LDTALQVLQDTDFKTFSRLADLPMAMTAHIIYSAIDAQNCATLSPKTIALIRAEIGFDGLLMTDDLSMKALSGSFANRVSSAIAAGCDMMLHCNGDPSEMDAILHATPQLSGLAAERASRALALRNTPNDFDRPAAEASLEIMMKDASNG
jgi:beta-N-acetylhexosaminidase